MTYFNTIRYIGHVHILTMCMCMLKTEASYGSVYIVQFHGDIRTCHCVFSVRHCLCSDFIFNI